MSRLCIRAPWFMASVLLLGTALSAVAHAQTLTPALSFGNWAIDTTSAARIATLTNNTHSAITIHTITVPSPFFLFNDNCPISPASLGAGQSCMIGVKFSPTATNTYSGNLRVTYNTSGSLTDPVSGTGIPDVSLSPATWTPGNQVINTTTSQLTFTITNHETSTSVTVTSVVPPAGFTVNNTCTTITASGNCTFTATFDPTAVTSYSGNVAVSDTTASGNQQQTAAVSGSGIYPAVPASFFAMDINQNNAVNGISTDPWPGTGAATGTNFGTYRTLGSSIKWADLYNCSSNQYVFASPNQTNNALYRWLTQANPNQNLMITAYYTPDCFVPPSVQTSTGSQYCAFWKQGQVYGCDLPGDVLTSASCPGFGTIEDCTWVTFISNLVNYVTNPTYFPNQSHTIYLEVWNEVNIGTECNPANNPKGNNGNCTPASLYQMTIDASNYGKINSNIQVVSPTVTAINSSNDCTKTTAAIAGYFANQLLPTGVYNYADVIGYHGYVTIPGVGTGFTNPPDPAAGASCENDLINSVKQAIASVVGSSASKSIYDTEGSWAADCNTPGCTYTPDTWIQGSSQPANQVRAEEAAFTGAYYLIHASNQPIYEGCVSDCNPLAGFSWYGWDFDNRGEPGSTGQFWDQALGTTGGLTPAGTAYTVLNSWLLGAAAKSQPASPVNACTTTADPVGVWTCKFSGPGTYTAVAVWDNSKTCINNFDSNGLCKYPNTTSFTFPAGAYTEWRDLYNNTPTPISGTTTSLPIGLVPILVDNGQ